MAVFLNDLAAIVPSGEWLLSFTPIGNVPIAGLALDSRRVKPGDLFFALPGERIDGARFILDAVRAGAAAVVTESGTFALPGPSTPPLLRARSARRVLGLIAARFHGEPSRRLRVSGVTGTDGKTSTVWFARQILAHAGRRVVSLGTLGIQASANGLQSWAQSFGRSAIDGEAARTWLPTTPEAPEFQATLARFADGGIEDVITEVSSHALAQERIFGTQFRTVALTHVATDHLDFHHNREAYLAAKAKLFARETRGGPLERSDVTAILNIDDAFGRELAGRLKDALTYGLSPAARVRAERIRNDAEGILLGVDFDGQSVRLAAPICGDFHEENLLAAAAIAYGLSVAPDIIAQAVAALEPVPGRFEKIAAGQSFTVIVDYAHTADGLEKLLSAARRLTRGTLWVVFGCGGDRDRSKRPAMGRIAGELADRVIVTSDNPRSEDPEAIIDEIRPGLATAAAPSEIVVDRRAALALALQSAGPGDTVVVAGKGAETLQVFRNRVEPFDDRQVVRALIQQAAARRG